MKEKQLLKDETLAEKLIKRGFWLYFFSFLIAPSGYIIKLLISNDLSVQEVWVIYSILWFMSILANYNDLWLSESLKYFLPKFWINKKYNEFKTSIFMALWLQTVTAIIIAIWLWFSANWLWTYYFHSELAINVLKILSLWFIIYNIFKSLDIIFQSFQDTFAYKLIEFIRMWWTVILIAVLFFSDKWNVLNYSLAWFVWNFLALIIAIIIFIKKYKHILNNWNIIINKQLNKQILSYSVWVIIWSQAWILLSQIDQQMIIFFLWPQQAWYYTAYLSLFGIYNIILWPLFAFLFPITTELATKKETWKLSLLLSIFLKYFLILWIFWGIFISILWPIIAFILFWNKFIPSWELVQLGWLFLFLNIFVSILFPILAWLWKIKERVKILWTAAIINIILNISLIHIIWIYWVIISTIIWSFIITLLSIKIIKKEKINIKKDYKFIIKNLFLWWILAIILFFSKNVILHNGRLETLIYVFITWILYITMIILFNLKEFKLFINEIKKVKWK